ncbi:MAG TPA: Crp/Fnr family transcriptional regulator [bacterium]|nr:Crp/Fnr family transcriptional regulator [bacterium]
MYRHVPLDEPPLPELDCSTCPALSMSEWRVLTPAQVKQLSQAKEVRRYRRGDSMYRQGDPCKSVYCIHSGTVAIRRTDHHGNAVLLELKQAGDVMGYRACFSRTERHNTATASDEVIACALPGPAMFALINDNPMLGHAFLARLAHELARAHDAILTHTQLPVRARMARLLMRFVERRSLPRSSTEVQIHLPVSRHDLAELLAARPETIARTIAALERDGVATFSGRMATIANVSQLRDEMDCG